jgi:hypothetical protein
MKTKSLRMKNGKLLGARVVELRETSAARMARSVDRVSRRRRAA